MSFQALTDPEAQPDLTVAGQIARTGEHEIPEPGKAHEGRRPRPKRHTKAAGFRKAPRDQRRPGIQAEAEPVTEARSDGDDVLDRPAKLHTRHVRTGIGSEPRRGEHFPQPCPKPFVAAAEYHRRGLAGRHLKGERRPERTA